MKFIDEVTITVASGSGGPGCVSFRREAKVPRGGPDGGDGGKGGDVIFEVSDRLHSLLDLKFRKKYSAGNGQQGMGSQCSGTDGKDLVLTVPPGTVLRNSDNQVIADLSAGDKFTFLKGGLGGKGNLFYKNSVNQAPDFAQKGLPGEEQVVTLELKLLADVGIIGFPNAGKSTLISHISAAKPKIADYPFTTLIPNLGVVRIDDEKSFVVADIPGLIKGAHEGVGLGIQFLKHIERTRVFVHMIDCSGLSGREPLQDFIEINDELKKYDEMNEGQLDFEPLSTREQIVVMNKIDAAPEGFVEEIQEKFKKLGVDPLLVSAATGQSVKELKFLMGRKVFKGEEDEY